jgi:DNA replication protein DnaC
MADFEKLDSELLVDLLEKKAEISIKTNEGDFVLDGLLHCGKCKTPKQTRVEIFGKVRTPMCLCKCEAERVEKEKRERDRLELELEFDKARYRIESKVDLLSWLNRQPYKISKRLIAERTELMREICFAEDDMRHWTFANDDGENEKIMKAMLAYAVNFDTMKEQGKGLILFGSVGTGKTYAAAAIANELIDAGVPVYMTNFARIANTVSGLFDGRQEYYDSLNRFPLLIIDDLAAERKTEYMSEIVFNVIDSRYRSGLPLIVTTNLTAEELKHPSELGYKRTFSRLLEMCLPVKVEGKDKRIEKLKADIQPMKDLLGLD